VQLPWQRRSKQFEQAALPHLADVYRLARQMSDETRASDLVQETFLRAWRYFDTFEPGTNCRAWLLKILHNVWADQWRQPRLEIRLVGEEEALVEPYYDWEDESLKEELSHEVAETLSQLPAVYRWAVMLADVEELSYQEEMAQVMSCPVGTVMSRVNRGRRTLARLLRARAESCAGEVDRVAHESQKDE
jgi:RNA polymerase sigma-70 factor (ECF subfamily)